MLDAYSNKECTYVINALVNVVGSLECIFHKACVFSSCSRDYESSYSPVYNAESTTTAIQQQVLFNRYPVNSLDSSGSSRQSVVSNNSQLRSARSSMSSRISHYLPMMHCSSTRSSVTSAYLATPWSTRSNSPNNGTVGEASYK